MPPRDLTDAEFAAECHRLGFTPLDVGGYYDLGIAGHKASASVYNFRQSNRAALANLVRERRRQEKVFMLRCHGQEAEQ